MEFSSQRPHRTAMVTAHGGVPVEFDEIDLEYYLRFHDSVEAVSDLSAQAPYAVEPALTEALAKAHELWKESQGAELVELWLASRSYGRYYHLDTLGMIGLAMTRHPDLLPATQSMINDLERHLAGAPPADLAVTESPILPHHLRQLLALWRFNFAEDLWRAGDYERALANVDLSLKDLRPECEIWRRVDRLVSKVFLLTELSRPSEANQAIAELNRVASDDMIQKSIAKWLPQMPNLTSAFGNDRH